MLEEFYKLANSNTLGAFNKVLDAKALYLMNVEYAVPIFEIQNDFGVSRGVASFSYTMVMLGFGLGGILFGRLVDLHGILKPLMISVLALATSFVVTGMVRTIYMLYLMHFMIGFFGCAVVFAPLVSDISKWFKNSRINPIKR